MSNMVKDTALNHPHNSASEIPDRIPVSVLRKLSVINPKKAVGAIAE